VGQARQDGEPGIWPSRADPTTVSLSTAEKAKELDCVRWSSASQQCAASSSFLEITLPTSRRTSVRVNFGDDGDVERVSPVKPKPAKPWGRFVGFLIC
jgi:hypothetical protein